MGEAFGRSQGGFPTKLHLARQGRGRPITAVLTGGERHEQFALDALTDRGGGASPGGRPSAPAAPPNSGRSDRCYSSPLARCRLKLRRIERVVPTRKDQPRQRDFDKAAYRERNKVEPLINRLKQYRRIATRYEKRATNCPAMVTLGMTKFWLT